MPLKSGKSKKVISDSGAIGFVFGGIACALVGKIIQIDASPSRIEFTNCFLSCGTAEGRK